MAGVLHTRQDVWELSVNTVAAAKSQDWHPVLDGYARGVEAMINRDAQLTVDSWRWAANTHGIPSGTQPKPLWAQCAHATRFFLPWHRAYLAWFEKMVQHHIGDDGWALPYWDYSDPDRPETLQVPPEFRVPQRTVNGTQVKNHLYLKEFDRPGHPMASDVEVVPAMSQRFFALRWPRQGFGGVDGPERQGGLLEDEPHNYVHGDIGGPTGLMRSTTVAGRDPIFWLHHANIDRLWEVWRKLPGSVELMDQVGLPADTASEWQSASFTFGDTGATAVYSIDDLVDTTAEPLNYEYEVTELPQAQLAVVMANRNQLGRGPMGLDEDGPPAEDWDPVAATADTTAIGEGGAERALTFDPRQLGLAPEMPSGLIIELAGVRCPVDCHNVYVVDVAAGPDRPTHRAGRFSTFGLSGTPADEERSYVVDATAAIPDLVADGWNGSEVVVRVLPETAGAGAGPEPQGIEVQQITVYRRR